MRAVTPSRTSCAFLDVLASAGITSQFRAEEIAESILHALVLVGINISSPIAPGPAPARTAAGSVIEKLQYRGALHDVGGRPKV